MKPTMIDDLLQGGQDVPFVEIEATLARLANDERQKKPARALTATVIVVGPQQRLVAAADALEHLGEAGGVRSILLSEGTASSPVARVSEHAIAVTGLKPTYLNNAVAALRLSNLPAVVWWRGGSLESLDDLVDLADRFVMDAEEPDAVWEHAVKLFEHTALTDIRWAALTRWRAALAHLFDLPQVRRRAAGLTSVTIAACDTAAARLYAGWLQSSLEWGKEVGITIAKKASDPPCPPLHGVALEGGGLSIALNLRATKTCVEASVDGVDVSARIVPLGDGSLKAFIGEELTVRTRDLAFERALVAAREITA